MRSFDEVPLRTSAQGSSGSPCSLAQLRVEARSVAPSLNRGPLTIRLESARLSFAARRVSLDVVCDLSRALRPTAGDLVLARVMEIGQHARLENPHGRRAQLYPGDEIIVAYGARYAPDQFEAVVPEDLGACDLVAGGGIAGKTVNRHTRMKKPTTIAPIGLLLDSSGQPVNVRRFALAPPQPGRYRRNVIAVVGTSMNAGKTTLAANLIRGLSRSGLRVGACKVTGTGSGGDLWSMADAGAVRALDFTDAGYATTSGISQQEAEDAAHLLVSHLEAEDVDVVVVEIADGLLQRETSALLSASSSFRPRIDAIMLAAADALGATAGAQWLVSRGLPLKGVSGLVGLSPLASREVEQTSGLRVMPSDQFLDGEYAARLCFHSTDTAPNVRARS